MKKVIDSETIKSIDDACECLDMLEDALIKDSVLTRGDINDVLIRMWFLSQKLKSLTYPKEV